MDRYFLGTLTALTVLGTPPEPSSLLTVVILSTGAASVFVIVVPRRERCPECDDVIGSGTVYCPGCGEDLGCDHDRLPDDAEHCPVCGGSVTENDGSGESA